jgi:hypothetical protein
MAKKVDAFALRLMGARVMPEQGKSGTQVTYVNGPL